MRRHHAPACRATALLVAVAAGGCSLLFESVRPTAGAPRNLFCHLEYRPDPARPGEPDLLFLAGGQPYRIEELSMSLPDGLLHALFAPGRHLVEPPRLTGVRCEPPVWSAGYRLPGTLAHDHYLLCRRDGLERVEIEVRTKWGSCRREIAAGDATPRCRVWFGRTSAGLERLSERVCPPLPEPTRASRRGITPCGTQWVVLREGDGRAAALGERIVFHQTAVRRDFEVESSSHFEGRPRRALLAAPALADWIVEGVAEMRVGELRRVSPPVGAVVAAGAGDEAGAPLFHDIELLAAGPP